jgi:hypothetical protein
MKTDISVTPPPVITPSGSCRQRLGSAAIALAIALATLSPLMALGDRRPPAGEAGVVDWPTIEQLLAERQFASKEELFQLLHILYSDKGMTAFRLEKETLDRLDGRIDTLFPLDGCTSIEVHEDLAEFRFDGEQDVFIPNTWLQASLHLPPRLVLRIEKQTPASGPGGAEALPGDRELAFRIEEGYMQVRFSFLLNLFGGRLRDAEGKRLVYRINDDRRISRLHLVELTPLGSDRIRAVATAADTPGTQWFDIVHPDFPGDRDIGLAGSSLFFLGTQVELLPEQMIKIGEEPPQKNEQAWQWFDRTMDAFRTLATAGGTAPSIDYTRDFGYHFEERQIVMNMGFQGGGAQP